MNKQDVESMAREAGFARLTDGLRDDERSDYFDCWPDQLHKFAALVLEKAAQIADAGVNSFKPRTDWEQGFSDGATTHVNCLRAMAEGLKV